MDLAPELDSTSSALVIHKYNPYFSKKKSIQNSYEDPEAILISPPFEILKEITDHLLDQGLINEQLDDLVYMYGLPQWNYSLIDYSIEGDFIVSIPFGTNEEVKALLLYTVFNDVPWFRLYDKTKSIEATSLYPKTKSNIEDWFPGLSKFVILESVIFDKIEEEMNQWILDVTEEDDSKQRSIETTYIFVWWGYKGYSATTGSFEVSVSSCSGGGGISDTDWLGTSIFNDRDNTPGGGGYSNNNPLYNDVYELLNLSLEVRECVNNSIDQEARQYLNGILANNDFSTELCEGRTIADLMADVLANLCSEYQRDGDNGSNSSPGDPILSDANNPNPNSIINLSDLSDKFAEEYIKCVDDDIKYVDVAPGDPVATSSNPPCPELFNFQDPTSDPNNTISEALITNMTIDIEGLEESIQYPSMLFQTTESANCGTSAPVRAANAVAAAINELERIINNPQLSELLPNEDPRISLWIFMNRFWISFTQQACSAESGSVTAQIFLPNQGSLDRNHADLDPLDFLEKFNECD